MIELVTFFSEPLSFAFMQRALIAVVMVGIVSAVVGTFVVLRGMAFFGDALAHAILPGVAIGFILGGGNQLILVIWTLITAVLTAVAIGTVNREARLKEDTSIGIIFAGMFALGIALISSQRDYAIDLSHVLFGNVLGVSITDLWIMGILGAAIVLTVAVFFKEFLILSFDPVFATTIRLPTDLLNYLLFILIAVTAVVSLQTVGVALMVAMLITPAATAYLLTDKMTKMVVYAAFIGVLSGIIGLYISFHVGIASGASIVLVSIGMFILTMLLSPKRGLISKRRP